jgi:hemerythrin superfamily protein
MNVLKLLKKDHSSIRTLFNQLARAGRYQQRAGIFEQLRRDFHIHYRAEEEIFYPALKALDGAESFRLVSAALREHSQMDELLTQISRLEPNDQKFEDHVETLFEHMDHHFEQEEGEIFQLAEENCSGEQLEDLGRQVEERKLALSRQMAA